MLSRISAKIIMNDSTSSPSDISDSPQGSSWITSVPPSMQKKLPRHKSSAEGGRMGDEETKARQKERIWDLLPSSSEKCRPPPQRSPSSTDMMSAQDISKQLKRDWKTQGSLGHWRDYDWATVVRDDQLDIVTELGATISLTMPTRASTLNRREFAKALKAALAQDTAAPLECLLTKLPDCLVPGSPTQPRASREAAKKKVVRRPKAIIDRVPVPLPQKVNKKKRVRETSEDEEEMSFEPSFSEERSYGDETPQSQDGEYREDRSYESPKRRQSKRAKTKVGAFEDSTTEPNSCRVKADAELVGSAYSRHASTWAYVGESDYDIDAPAIIGFSTTFEYQDYFSSS